MDFMNRGFRNGNQNTNNTSEHSTTTSQPQTSEPKKSSKLPRSGSMSTLQKAGSLGFLVALLIIVLGVIFAMMNSRTTYGEAKSVDTTKYQAVFLNGGQVYFGNVKDLNTKYLKLDNIFYLRVNQQVQPNSQTSTNNDVSLVKLGCELHGPDDMMIVNREQVIFWENLKNDGQVKKAIDQYKEKFPQGEDCNKQASSDNSSSNSTSSGSTSTTSNTSTTSKPSTTSTSR